MPISVTSASMPSCASARKAPVRPSPVWISSRMSTISRSLHSLRTWRK
ncbi:Uncharacterised protein [Bordetella pertussis]|nr:Uncharacterised protein [Bordetella pertussis]CFP69334.1 Uncharacterised protein [Bordetella pertussis]CFW48306.1 Uncharacterised protein [Bordetella pertussis]